MRPSLPCLAIVAALLPGVACAAAPTQRQAGKFIAQRCAPCHAIGLADSSRNPEAPPFRDLIQRYSADDLQESLAEGIFAGHSTMPEFRMSPREIAAFQAFLQSLQSR